MADILRVGEEESQLQQVGVIGSQHAQGCHWESHIRIKNTRKKRRKKEKKIEQKLQKEQEKFEVLCMSKENSKWLECEVQTLCTVNLFKLDAALITSSRVVQLGLRICPLEWSIFQSEDEEDEDEEREIKEKKQISK